MVIILCALGVLCGKNLPPLCGFCVFLWLFLCVLSVLGGKKLGLHPFMFCAFCVFLWPFPPRPRRQKTLRRCPLCTPKSACADAIMTASPSPTPAHAPRSNAPSVPSAQPHNLLDQRRTPMNISLSQADTLTCPACNASFEATIWLIIAANEHPDLIERIRTGTLHTVTCPHCDHTGSLDAPLLIFRPDAEPPILFSPAQQTSREQDQQHAAELVAQLRERLGSAWREAWLAQGVPGVARALLPVALANDPEAGLRDRRERDPATFAQLEAAARQAMEASGEAVVPPAMAMPATVQPLIDRINQLNRIAEIPQRVELCRQALTLVTKATNPQLWAKLHFELGNSLYQNRLGDRAANLEQAIEAYQQALTVFTQDALPIDWANTLHNLAAAHQARIGRATAPPTSNRPSAFPASSRCHPA